MRKLIMSEEEKIERLKLMRKHLNFSMNEMLNTIGWSVDDNENSLFFTEVLDGTLGKMEIDLRLINDMINEKSKIKKQLI